MGASILFIRTEGPTEELDQIFGNVVFFHSLSLMVALGNLLGLLEAPRCTFLQQLLCSCECGLQWEERDQHLIVGLTHKPINFRHFRALWSWWLGSKVGSKGHYLLLNTGDCSPQALGSRIHLSLINTSPQSTGKPLFKAMRGLTWQASSEREEWDVTRASPWSRTPLFGVVRIWGGKMLHLQNGCTHSARLPELPRLDGEYGKAGCVT